MTSLFNLYLQLTGLIICGFVCGRILPISVANRLGIGLFWVGVPISIIAFVRKTDLNGAIWIAPVVAYIAIAMGLIMAWLAIQTRKKFQPAPLTLPTRGSVLLAAMFGNTGYLGYPVILSLCGSEHFAWALFYDLLGTLIGSYGLGVALAAKHSGNIGDTVHPLRAILINPPLWSFFLGIWLYSLPLPKIVESGLDAIAWSAIACALILIGMRLSYLRSRSTRSTSLGFYSIAIKMLLVPLAISQVLPLMGILSQPVIRVIVLQSAMPPAFANLLLAENFHLNRDVTVTTLAFGTIFLLATLPLWLWLT